MSLRIRLLLVILTVYAVGGFFLTRWMLDQIRPRYLESMEESLVDASVLLASMLEAETTASGPDVAEIRLAFERARAHGFEAKIFSLAKNAIDLRVYVVNAQGRVLFDSMGRAGRWRRGSLVRWSGSPLTLGRCAMAGRRRCRRCRDER
jgi:two-component system sensor histidine kinase CreC